MDNAFNSAEVRPGVLGDSSAGKTELPGVYKHLMTGYIPYMLPLVVAEGCVSHSFVFGIVPSTSRGTLAAALFQIGGKAAFALMVPVPGRFIALTADRPASAPAYRRDVGQPVRRWFPGGDCGRFSGRLQRTASGAKYCCQRQRKR